ncbi:hypothetical protein [Rufibacter immobilis]|uniref:hypothetical protein n=1 Tax=Rufibacter immobilis TaxID=1348778 RepID=UPI0035EC8A63
MKNYLFILLITIVSLQVHGQRMHTDIFNDLQYESKGQKYKATLKKDIFDNLIFSDNNNNEITYTKKYLDLNHKGLITDEEAKLSFFGYFINRYSSGRDYKAKYDVDIFDKVIVEDNKNNRVEIGEDIFGNFTYEENRNNSKLSIKRDLSGNLEFNSEKEQASLRKDIFNKWSYKDSSGNNLEFSNKSWSKLMQRHGSDEEVFYYLVKKLLLF